MGGYFLPRAEYVVWIICEELVYRAGSLTYRNGLFPAEFLGTLTRFLVFVADPEDENVSAYFGASKIGKSAVSAARQAHAGDEIGTVGKCLLHTCSPAPSGIGRVLGSEYGNVAAWCGQVDGLGNEVVVRG